MNDFAFICIELERRTPFGPYGGYPCIGYPLADKLIPAFQAVGANFETFTFANIETPFKNIIEKIESQNILIQWGWITKDYMDLLESRKNTYIIPHSGERVAGELVGIEERMRGEITNRSTRVIFEFEHEKNLWKNLECSKFVVFNPPTRLGKKYDKEESRKTLGIKTKYALICWGNYDNKSYEKIIPWLSEWNDTSILFCGSGFRERLVSLTQKQGVSDRTFFSPPAISDFDSDLWFSASDLCTIPRENVFGSMTPTYAIGEGKCVLVRPSPYAKELEKISGLVCSTNLKEDTRRLLLNEEERGILEEKSLKYAHENSYENYAIRVGKLMGFDYKEKEAIS